MNSCLYCGTSTPNNKFCSKSCQASYRNAGNKTLTHVMSKRGTCEAFNCSNHTYRAEAKLCKEHKTEYDRLTYKQMWNMPLSTVYAAIHDKCPSKADKYRFIRRIGKKYHKEMMAKPCNNCGYDKYTEIAHVIPVSKFLPTHLVSDVNHYENVVQLCPNCHYELDKLDANPPVRDGKTVGRFPS